MVLVLSVIRCPDLAVPEQRRVPGGEYVLGRGAECDWVLRDPERVLSKRHCTVEFLAGDWQVRDLSTNGTFVNSAADPVGRDRIRSLRDGDRLRLGAYEIECRVEDEAIHGSGRWQSAQAIPDPMAAEPNRNWAAESDGGRPASTGIDIFSVPLPGLSSPAGGTPGGHAPLLPADFDPFAPDDSGPVMPDHRPSTSDVFTPPRATMPDLLPDDWAVAPKAPTGALDALPDPFADAPPGQSPRAANPAANIAALSVGDPFAAEIARLPDPFADLGLPSPGPDPLADPGLPVGQVPPAALRASSTEGPGVRSAALPSFDGAAPTTAPAPGDASNPFGLASPVATPPGAADPFGASGALAPQPSAGQPVFGARDPFGEADASLPGVAAPPPGSPDPFANPQGPAMATPPADARPPPHAGADGMDAALALLFRSAGLGVPPPGTDAAAAIAAAGVTLRASVAGMRALLIARADVKREFRIEQTMLRAAGNNPVKFAATDDQAMQALLLAPRGDKGRASAALAETVRDLTAHQVATLAATQAAARALLTRLAPAPLESDAPSGGIMPGAREKALWAAYKKLHQQVTLQFEDDFDSAFGKAFARAYEEASRAGA